MSTDYVTPNKTPLSVSFTLLIDGERTVSINTRENLESWLHGLCNSWRFDGRGHDYSLERMKSLGECAKNVR
jgi:hypothetical protein